MVLTSVQGFFGRENIDFAATITYSHEDNELDSVAKDMPKTKTRAMFPKLAMLGAVAFPLLSLV